MADTYCEIMVEGWSFPPGVYIFEEDDVYPAWGKYGQVIQMSHCVWKETNEGVFWMKNRLTGSKIPKKLTEDELKEFMWTKLKAEAI